VWIDASRPSKKSKNPRKPQKGPFYILFIPKNHFFPGIIIFCPKKPFFGVFGLFPAEFPTKSNPRLNCRSNFINLPKNRQKNPGFDDFGPKRVDFHKNGLFGAKKTDFREKPCFSGYEKGPFLPEKGRFQEIVQTLAKSCALFYQKLADKYIS